MIPLDEELKKWWERWLGPTPSPFYQWEKMLADLKTRIEAREDAARRHRDEQRDLEDERRFALEGAVRNLKELANSLQATVNSLEAENQKLWDALEGKP